MVIRVAGLKVPTIAVSTPNAPKIQAQKKYAALSLILSD